MSYQVFFILCLIGVVLISVFFECRVRALAFGCVGLGAGYLFEIKGTAGNDWGYEGVDSLLFISGIPIEVLFGYFTAVFLLMVVVENLPDLSTRERREAFLRVAFLSVGIVLLSVTYVYGTMSLAVGWAFMGIYGLSISPDRSLPLTVGLLAFISDWIVEGALTASTEYYAQGWDPTIALVFMFAGMFIVGVLTNRQYISTYLSSRS